MNGNENPVNNPVKTSKITPPTSWNTQQARDADQCFFACQKQQCGLTYAQYAILIYGEGVVDLAWVRSETVDLFKKVKDDQEKVGSANDKHELILYQMMLEESYMLFVHALDEDLKQWNHSRSV